MIFASYASLLIFGLLDNLRGPFYSAIINEFGVNESRGAFVFAFTSIFASLSSFFGEPVLNRWGAKRLLNSSSVMMGAGYLIMGTAPHFAIMIMGAAALGVGLGWASIAQNYSVSHFAPAGRKSALMSGLHSMYGLASAIAPWFAYLLLRSGWGWRQSFIAAGGLPLILFAVTWFQLRNLKGRLKASDHETPLRLPKELRLHIILAAFLAATYLLGEISVGTRLVRWLEVSHGFSADTGALYLTGFFSSLFLARMAAWRIAPEKLENLRIAMAVSIIGGGLALVATLMYSPDLVFLAGLALGPFYPMALSYIHLRFRSRAAAALSYTFGIGSMTVVCMHFLIGVVADTWGMTAAMAIGPMGLLVTLGLLVFELRIKR
jgi:MFS family permease